MDPVNQSSSAAASSRSALPLPHALTIAGEPILKFLQLPEVARLKVVSPQMQTAVVQRQSEVPFLHRVAQEATDASASAAAAAAPAGARPPVNLMNCIGPSSLKTMFMTLLLSEPFDAKNMGTLIERLVIENRGNPDAMVAAFALLSQAIHESPVRPTAAQMHRFIAFMMQNTPPQLNPWLGYQILQQFMPHHTEIVTDATRSFLRAKAEQLIQPWTREHDNYPALQYARCEIDPRVWFGCNRSRCSFLEERVLPPLVREAILNRVRQLGQERPVVVSLGERAEALIPHNFAFDLVTELTQAEVFVGNDHTCYNPSDFYSWSNFQSLSQEDLQALAARYPARQN